jgi:GTP-binding protein
LITGSKIEKFAKRTDFDNIHGVNRLRDIIKKMGITHELERQGATGESIIQIGNHEFTLLEQ